MKNISKIILALTVVSLFAVALNMACAPVGNYIKTGTLTGHDGNSHIAIEDPDYFKNNEGDPAKRAGQDIKTQSLKAQLVVLLKKHERILAAEEDLIASKRSPWFH